MVNTPSPKCQFLEMINCMGGVKVVPGMKLVEEIRNALNSTIKSREVFNPDERMALRSQGAGRNEVHPWLLIVALFSGTSRAAISASKSHASMDLRDGDLMFWFPVIEAILMATTVAFTLVPMKQAYLFIGQTGVPPMFLKLCRMSTVLFALAARMTMSLSLVMKADFAIGVIC